MEAWFKRDIIPWQNEEEQPDQILFEHTGVMKVYFSTEYPNRISMQAAGSTTTIYTSERPVPYSRWMYIRATANTDEFGLTVISLDGELIASNYYEGGFGSETSYTNHRMNLNPSYDLVFGADYHGLIKGIKYYLDNTISHSEVPPSTAPNFTYRQDVKNNIYVFFSFTKAFLTPV